jgi:hypothetical protein
MVVLSGGQRWTWGLGVAREADGVPVRLGLPTGQGEEGGHSPTVHVDSGAEKNSGSSMFQGGGGIRWPEGVAVGPYSGGRERRW